MSYELFTSLLSDAVRRDDFEPVSYTHLLCFFSVSPPFLIKIYKYVILK